MCAISWGFDFGSRLQRPFYSAFRFSVNPFKRSSNPWNPARISGHVAEFGNNYGGNDKTSEMACTDNNYISDI